jgi:predicted dehydrogenase
MSKQRCLMVGAGGMAGAYLNLFFPRFGDRLEVVGLVDVNRAVLDAAGDRLGLPASARFSEIAPAFAAVEADFCCIVIPPAFHQDAVMAAVERRLPILSEKPIADTWEACVAIYRAVTEAGVPMQVVQNYRYTGRILTVKQVLASGRLGEPYYTLGRFAADYRARNSWGKFRHEIPHSLLVEGSVHHCRSIAGRDWNPGHQSFDGECLGLFLLQMTNGITAFYEGNCLEAALQNSWHAEMYRIECANGAVSLDRDQQVRVHERQPDGTMRIEEPPMVRPEFDGHLGVIDQFLTWRDGGPMPECVLADNIKSAATLFAAVDASVTGQTVDVPAKLAAAGI